MLSPVIKSHARVRVSGPPWGKAASIPSRIRDEITVWPLTNTRPYIHSRVKGGLTVWPLTNTRPYSHSRLRGKIAVLDKRIAYLDTKKHDYAVAVLCKVAPEVQVNKMRLVLINRDTGKCCLNAFVNNGEIVRQSFGTNGVNLIAILLDDERNVTLDYKEHLIPQNRLGVSTKSPVIIPNYFASWSKVTEADTVGSSSIVEHDGKLYRLDTYTGDMSILDLNGNWNVINTSWPYKSSFGTVLISHGDYIAALGSCIYTQGSGTYKVRRVQYKYDPVNNVYIPTGNYPGTAVFTPSVFKHKGYTYSMFGITNRTTTTTNYLEFGWKTDNLNTWIKVPVTLPPGFTPSGISMASDGDKVYMAGGLIDGKRTNLVHVTVDFLSWATIELTYVDDGGLIWPRMVQVDDMVYMIGGSDDDNAPRHQVVVFKDGVAVERVNTLLDDDTVHVASAAAIDKTLYIQGGIVDGKTDLYVSKLTI